MLFPPPYSSQILQPSPCPLIQLHVLLHSLSKKKINKKTNIQSPFYVSQLLLAMGPALVCSGYTQQHSTGENWFSILTSCLLHKPSWLNLPFVGIPTNNLNQQARRGKNQERQEGSMAQHDSVDSFHPNFWSLTPGSLFQAYLSTAQFQNSFWWQLISPACTEKLQRWLY